jgi:hypothetical protein
MWLVESNYLEIWPNSIRVSPKILKERNKSVLRQQHDNSILTWYDACSVENFFVFGVV